MSARGTFDIDLLPQDVRMLESSGHGELQAISGKLEIIQDADGHQYELAYEF